MDLYSILVVKLNDYVFRQNTTSSEYRNDYQKMIIIFAFHKLGNFKAPVLRRGGGGAELGKILGRYVPQQPKTETHK